MSGPCWCGGCRRCLHDMGEDCGDEWCRNCIGRRREEAAEAEVRAEEWSEELAALVEDLADSLETCAYCRADCGGQCRDDAKDEVSER